MENELLESVISTIEYEFVKDILVKPLDAIMVKTEFEEQIPTGEKDEEGFNLYDTKKITKDVESDFAKGLILALPKEYKPIEGQEPLKEGNVIIYPKKFAKHFDLFRDSQLVKPYDVIAIVK